LRGQWRKLCEFESRRRHQELANNQSATNIPDDRRGPEQALKTVAIDAAVGHPVDVVWVP